MKKGDKVTMLFHCAGVVSEEEVTVMNVDGCTIAVDDIFDTEFGEAYRLFNTNTGKCLNDSNYFGAKRTLKLD